MAFVILQPMNSSSFNRSPILPEPIRTALIRLAPILNATGAPWVLGGSCSLALHGVPVTPQDLDIATDREGAYQIGEALRKVAQEIRPVQWGESERIRSHYGQYRIGDVQVDVIGAAELREGDNWTPAKLPSEWEVELVAVPGADLSVPAFTLQHELVAYRRLQREVKAQLIEEQLQSGGHAVQAR